MKKFQSLIFRFVLICVSIAIVNTHPNVFTMLFYYMTICLYLLGYLVLRKYDLSLIRLFFDFIFINIIIVDKDISDPLVFFMIYLPLINAINFSGKKKHYLILLLVTLITYYICANVIDIYCIIPTISLGIMYAISCVNYSNWKVEKEISEKVDRIYLSIEKKSHMIFNGLVEDLNHWLRFKNDEGVRRIRVYSYNEQSGNMLWLEKASVFIWNRTFHIHNEVLSKLLKKGLYVSNDNGTWHLYSFVIKDEMKYVFICDIIDQTIFHSRIIYLRLYHRVLNKIFNKVSMLLNSENKLKQVRDEKFNEIKDTVLYVNKAVRVMHFIRNQMTPFSNLVAYYKREPTLSDDIREKFGPKVKAELEQASRSLNEILLYADDLLDNSKNPFEERKIKGISIQKIYIVISELVETHFKEDIVQFDDSFDLDTLQSREIRSNLMQCKILITDWIENMRKYSGEHRFIKLSMSGDTFIVHFENNYTNSDDNILRLIKDLTSKTKDAVLEGKNNGHGIYIIKSIANTFDISIEAKKMTSDKYGNMLSFDIAFKTYGKEDSNI